MPAMYRRLLALALILTLSWPALAQPTSWEEVEKTQTPQAVTAMLTSLAFMSLRLGSYDTTNELIATIDKRVERTGAPDGWDILHGELALAPLLEALGRGQFEQVLQDGPAAIERARKANNPGRELSLTLLVLEAARVTGRARVLEKYLPRALELSANPKTTSGRMARFVVESYDALRRYRLNPPTMEQLQSDYDRAYLQFAELKVDLDFMRNSVVEGRLVGPAVQFWWERALATGGAVTSAQWILQDLDRVEKPFLYDPPDQDPVDYMRELNFQGIVAALDAAIGALDILAAIPLPGVADQVASQAVALTKEIDGLYGQLTEVETGMKAELPLLKTFSFTHGELSLIRGRIHQRLSRSRVDQLTGTATPDQVEAITRELAIASEAFADSDSGAMQEEISFDRLRILMKTHPAGWEGQADAILGGMIPRLEKAGYRPALIRALTIQGRILADQKRTPEAIAALKKAVDLTEAYINEVGGGAETAARLRSESRELYDLLTRLQVESGEIGDAADTFDRYRQLSSASQFGMQDLTPRKAATRALVQRATDAQTEIQAVEDTRLSYAAPGVARLADTRQDYYRVLQEIQDQDQAYARLQVRPKTFSKVQKSLPEDAVLVQLFPSDNYLYLFVATREALKVRRVDARSQELDALVGQFRRRVTAYARTADGTTPFKLEDDPELAATLKALSGFVLDPLAEDLQGKKVVAFVPTGTLTYFPFQTLLYQNGYLVQSLDVVTLVKASDLDQLDQAPVKPENSLLALGDPDGTLKAARTEVQSLQKLFPKSQVWIGPEATSERLSNVKVGFVHLATHGNLNPTDPLQSYLVVARSPRHSDRLTVNEIAGLNLDGVQLVTLSACSTALADKDPGVGLELASMADAFSYAGSPTLVASLWKVADEPTQALMLEFYAELKKGSTRGEALRQAQVALLTQPRYAHPFYWAPFTLMGDWR